MNVLVTGGTGTLGRQVVLRLRQGGHRARILSRHPEGHVDAVQVDLASAAGLSKALAGMDSVIHLASAAREPWRFRATDVGGTRRLLEAAQAAGIRHFVYVSIVGADRVAYPYYRAKVAAEKVVQEDRVPWSILRATQFHALMEVFLGTLSRFPWVTAIPFEWKFQPVDARDVAEHVIEVVAGEPAGRLPDFGGPDVLEFKTIGRRWIAARAEKRRLVNLRLPFRFSREVAEGRLLCPDHRDGTISFDRYLAEKYHR